MLSLPGSVRVFLARGAVDFRKAHDGLVAIVRNEFGDDPFGGDVFVFFNRRRDRIKVLVWDRNGFWLMYKRLERGNFEKLSVSEGETRVEIDRARLAMLLEGITVKGASFRKHFTRRVRIQARDEHGPQSDATSR